MELAELILDYLRVLVWPVVAGLVLFWLRTPVKDKIADLLKVGLGSANAEFAQRATAQLEHGAREQTDSLREASSDEEGIETDDNVRESATAASTRPSEDNEGASSGGEASPVPVGAEPPPVSQVGRLDLKRRRAELARRVAVEELITQGADWGREMARLGLDGRPKVEWTASGEPTIAYDDRHAREARSPQRNDWDAYVENLESEVRRLRREMHQAPFTATSFASTAERLALQQELAEAESRLRAAHPISGLI